MTLTREEQRLIKIISRLEGELYEERHQVNLHKADVARAERVAAEYQDKLERLIDENINLKFRLDQNNEIMVSLHQAWERCNTVIELLEGAAMERWIEGHDPQKAAKQLSLLARYINDDTPLLAGRKHQQRSYTVQSEIVRNIFKELMSDESVEQQEEEATSEGQAVNTKLFNTELF